MSCADRATAWLALVRHHPWLQPHDSADQVLGQAPTSHRKLEINGIWPNRYALTNENDSLDD